MRNNNPGADDGASSLQIGFVINTGIMTVFITVMLVVLGGGFGEETTTQQELETVSEEIEANMISVDRLAQTESAEFSAFFSPPTSGVEYTATVDEGGNFSLSAPDGTLLEKERHFHEDEGVIGTEVDMDGDSVSFGQNDENVVARWDESQNEIEITVQSGVAQER